MFSCSVKNTFLDKAQQLASMSLPNLLMQATGRNDYAVHEARAYSSQFFDFDRLTVVRVKPEHVNAVLKKERRDVPIDDHNYRKRYGGRYGVDGGDKEYWEKLLSMHPGQKLPLLEVSFPEMDGQVFPQIRDLGGDATYVNAMIRDNNWPATYIATNVEDAARIRREWGAEQPSEQLDSDFSEFFQDQIVEALEVMRRGTVLGEAVKISARPAMGMYREDFSHDERELTYPRGNEWLVNGDTVTTEELLYMDAFPAAALVTQVHHRMVSALWAKSSPRKDVISDNILATYRDIHAEFSFAY